MLLYQLKKEKNSKTEHFEVIHYTTYIRSGNTEVKKSLPSTESDNTEVQIKLTTYS